MEAVSYESLLVKLAVVTKGTNVRLSAQLGARKDGGSGELGRTMVAAYQATSQDPLEQSTGCDASA